MPAANFTSPQTASANLVVAAETYRQRWINRIAELIHDGIDYTTPPATDAVTWRDSWCHLCDANDAFLGTLYQHAERVYSLRWTIEGGLKGIFLVCPDCQEEA